MNTLNTTIN